MVNKYYALEKQEKEAVINIYGDITSWPYLESDVSSYTLSKELESLDVDVIHVHLNSYGGEVGEGLAIFNKLKQHKAKVITYCDGLVCSIASVIYMAGDERIMSNASLLMIHNPWTSASGNANDFRKQADDLEIIGSASIAAYMDKVTISEEELKQLLDDETWLSASNALEKGFATSVTGAKIPEHPSQSARQSIVKIILQRTVMPAQKIEPEPETVTEPEEPPEPPAPAESQNKLMELFRGITRKEG